MEWFLLFVGVIIAAAILQVVGQSSKHKAQGQAIAALADFTPSVVMQGNSGGAGVAIDATRNKFAISYGPKRTLVFNYSDLVSVEVLKNGNSIQVTNRGSQIAGAAVGALLLGPVGLLLGGLTGSKRAVEKVSRLSLKIFTNDMIQPVHEIVFFEGQPAKPDSILVKAASQELDTWHGRFLTVMRMAPVAGINALNGPKVA